MTDLARRTVTGGAYGLLVLAAALSPFPVFPLLLVVATLLALRELLALSRAGVVAVLIEAVIVGLGIGSLYVLSLADRGALLTAILATWAADVGGYLVGSRLGAHKLVPRLSPGKTWEGTIGGFLAGGLVVLAGASVAPAVPDAAVLAILVGPVALAGDLAESWLKRRAGVKDSGSALPGHGGVLDRIDSLVAVAILVAALRSAG